MFYLIKTFHFQRTHLFQHLADLDSRRVMSFLSIAAYVVSGLTIVIVNKSPGANERERP